MKQILQHLRTGAIEVADIPAPQVRRGHLLVQTARSLVSAGTERMLVEFGRAGLIAKARSQPEKVKQVLDKIKTDGLLPTLETVFSRLDEPLPLGYCNVGRVLEVGPGVEGFAVGDRVASSGPHAEVVCVPSTLAARVPDSVSDEDAAFTVLGSIGLQGGRLAQPTFGECFVVVGLGLLGLMTIQFLRSSGCRVLGSDVNPERCRLAEQFGATAIDTRAADPVKAAEAFSTGRGVDGVIITASAKTDEIMHQAAQMCRKRGRIILVGVVGLNLRRADFYNKELTFQVSCAYGPGRYDSVYESGADYPYGYVRWTAGRNMQAVLDGIGGQLLNVQDLISHRFAHADAARAYEAVVNDPSVLGLTLEYPAQVATTDRTIAIPRTQQGASTPTGTPTVGVIGAGNFTKLVLLPAIKAAGVPIKFVASGTGVTAKHAANKFDAEVAGSDYRALLADPNVTAVAITTRHNAHAPMVVEALDAGKHVFVEKPLAIDAAGLDDVRAAVARHPHQHLFVGFNRRFAPHTVAITKALTGRAQPIAVNCVINAGEIPADTWIQDRAVGGGRIVGEGCHFIDLLLALVGAPITRVQAVMFNRAAGATPDDKMSINLAFADGSIGTVHYWANGPKSYPKERVELFSEGRVAVIDNWRKLHGYNWKSLPKLSTRQDKGHKAEVAAFFQRLRDGGPPLIAFSELEQVTQASFAAVRSAEEGITINLTPEPAPATEKPPAPA